MSKRRFFNTIKRRFLPACPLGGPKASRKIAIKKVSWEDSFWTKQLKGIETLGQGLVVMRSERASLPPLAS